MELRYVHRRMFWLFLTVFLCAIFFHSLLQRGHLVTEETLQHHFARYGTVIDVFVKYSCFNKVSCRYREWLISDVMLPTDCEWVMSRLCQLAANVTTVTHITLQSVKRHYCVLMAAVLLHVTFTNAMHLRMLHVNSAATTATATATATALLLPVISYLHTYSILPP